MLLNFLLLIGLISGACLLLTAPDCTYTEESKR